MARRGHRRGRHGGDGLCAWVAPQLFAMVGFILMPLALLAVRAVVGGTRDKPRAATSFVISLVARA